MSLPETVEVDLFSTTLVEVEVPTPAATVEVEAGFTGPQGPQGEVGPQGPPGVWEQLTQAEYDALSPPDPETLYVIIG